MSYLTNSFQNTFIRSLEYLLKNEGVPSVVCFELKKTKSKNKNATINAERKLIIINIKNLESRYLKFYLLRYKTNQHIFKCLQKTNETKLDENKLE